MKRYTAKERVEALQSGLVNATVTLSIADVLLLCSIAQHTLPKSGPNSTIGRVRAAAEAARERELRNVMRARRKDPVVDEVIRTHVSRTTRNAA